MSAHGPFLELDAHIHWNLKKTTNKKPKKTQKTKTKKNPNENKKEPQKTPTFIWGKVLF